MENPKTLLRFRPCVSVLLEVDDKKVDSLLYVLPEIPVDLPEISAPFGSPPLADAAHARTCPCTDPCQVHTRYFGWIWFVKLALRRFGWNAIVDPRSTQPLSTATLQDLTSIRLPGTQWICKNTSNSGMEGEGVPNHHAALGTLLTILAGILHVAFLQVFVSLNVHILFIEFTKVIDNVATIPVAW